MQRRSVLSAATAGLATAVPLFAQVPGSTRRIGMVTTGMSDAANKKLLEATVYKRLREMGWTIGHNLIIEYRSTEGHYDRFDPLTRELIELKVDVIFTGGGLHPLDAARRATSTIPIVMAGAYADPVGAGIVASLARPGGNVTGTAFSSAELPGKRLELLKQAFPSISRIGFLAEPGAALQTHLNGTLARPAERLKMEPVVRFEVRRPEEFEDAVRSAKQGGVEALLVSGTTLFGGQYLGRVAQAVNLHKLPSMGLWNYMADGGLLMGYSASIVDLYNEAAIYIDKIFRGARPAELPVSEPRRIELVVNLKTAALIGVTLPPSVLARADRVIV